MNILPILTLDLETTPHEALTWRVWESNIVKLLKEAYIMSFSAKWHHESKCIHMDILTHSQEEMLVVLHVLLDQALIVITHNGDKFDLKMIQYEMIKNGFDPPSEYRSVDTLKLSRKYTNAPYHKLGYLAELYNKNHQKLDHGMGIDLWISYLNGCPKAKKILKKYNNLDVLATEELYFGTFVKWDKSTNKWLARQGLQFNLN